MTRANMLDALLTYRFTITATVEDDQEGYGDPEWIADAAWGALTNLYGLECSYGQVELLPVGSHLEP